MATSRCHPSPLVVSCYSLGASRVRSTEVREVRNPTGTLSGTPGVAEVAGGRQGIGDITLSDQPGATAPARKGNVRKRPSEFERN